MTANGRDTDGRPGCFAGRLLGGLARLVLLYPLLSMGSQLGQAAQRALWPAVGTPYEGALVGSIAGLAIGLGLWRSALAAEDWRAALADATFVVVTALWLAAIALAMTGRIGAADLVVPWAACIVGSGAIALLLRR